MLHDLFFSVFFQGKSYMRFRKLSNLIWLPILAMSAPILASEIDKPLPAGCEIAHSRTLANSIVGTEKVSFPPIALQVRAPVEPSVFFSDGRSFLVYELQLQNFTNDSLTLRGIEVIDVDDKLERPIAKYDDRALNSILRAAGIDNGEEPRNLLKARQGVTAFLCLAFDEKAVSPSKIRHRIVLDNGIVTGSIVDTQKNSAPILGRPLSGADWVPLHGPHIGSHHRRGLWLHDGVIENSRRFAIDWRKTKNGSWFAGDARDLHAYFAYGEPVLAVAEGKVVLAKDQYPDNVPRTPAGFTPAAEITMESIAGNTVVIDIGGGQYASYAHLQPGSVLVKTGDLVKRGQPIAKVGNSGDSRAPHLHFQVSTNAQHLLYGEGLPFMLDQFRSKKLHQDWVARFKELPWGDAITIDFDVK